MLDQLWIGIYRAEPDEYSAELAVYEALLEASPVAETFDRDDAPLGHEILILQAGMASWTSSLAASGAARADERNEPARDMP